MAAGPGRRTADPDDSTGGQLHHRAVPSRPLLLIMKVGGLHELPTLREVARRRRRAPLPVEQTSDAYFPGVAERRTVPRAPLHFQRIELKYFLPYRYLDHFVERVSRRTDVDPYFVKEGHGHTRYPVTSLYFDSYDLAAWREKEDGQFFRRKIRLRTYTEQFSEQTPCFLEIKRRLDAVVLKYLTKGFATAQTLAAVDDAHHHDCICCPIRRVHPPTSVASGAGGRRQYMPARVQVLRRLNQGALRFNA